MVCGYTDWRTKARRKGSTRGGGHKVTSTVGTMTGSMIITDLCKGVDGAIIKKILMHWDIVLPPRR